VANKLKPILPSLREKKRYLTFEILSKEKIEDFPAVSSSIWANSLSFMGELGAAKAGIWLLADKYDENKQRGIIKVSNKYVNELKTSLSLIKEINKKEVIVRSIMVSGMLNKATQHIAV